jgi:3-hydroxyisobutyrate dehydrogenase-like beta-hydroxyacid dehydrogenase
MRVGLVGVGRTGDPVVRALLRAGHRVAVRDVEPSGLERLVGERATAAGTARWSGGTTRRR